MAFRPLNLLLLFGVHKIIQGVMIRQGLRRELQINQGDLLITLDQLMWASIALAAAGYLINDYYDQRADSINKPKKAVVTIKPSQNNNERIKRTGFVFINIFTVEAL